MHSPVACCGKRGVASRFKFKAIVKMEARAESGVVFFPSSRFPKTRSGSVGESRSRSRICSQATRKGHHSIADAGIPGIKNRTREKPKIVFTGTHRERKGGPQHHQGVDFHIRLTIETFPSLLLGSIFLKWLFWKIYLCI